VNINAACKGRDVRRREKKRREKKRKEKKKKTRNKNKEEGGGERDLHTHTSILYE